MRPATAILFVFIISFQAFYNAGVLAFWLLNRTEITATRCENRDRPYLHCEGKCYLKKKIAESPETAPVQQGKSKMPNFKKGIELAELPPTIPVQLAALPAAIASILIFELRSNHDLLATDDFFHPPALGAIA